MRVIESRGRCLFFHRLARLSQKGDFTRIRHSREGGNPASVTSKRPSLDSRFRGNDDSFVADSLWRARSPKPRMRRPRQGCSEVPKSRAFCQPQNSISRSRQQKTVIPAKAGIQERQLQGKPSPIPSIGWNCARVAKSWTCTRNQPAVILACVRNQ